MSNPPLTKSPASLDQAMRIGVAHHNAGRLKEAEAIYRQILSVQPEYADALHMLAVLAGHYGRFDLGIEMLRSAVALAPSNPNFHADLGSLLVTIGQFDQAIACYREAIRIDPRLATAHYNLGHAWFTIGQIDPAIESYRRAIAIDGNLVDAHYNLANALRRKGRMNEAIAGYQRVLSLDPKVIEAHNNLGNALVDVGQIDAAIVSFQRALQLNPRLVHAHSNLGNALKLGGYVEPAIASYKKAMEIDPTCVSAHDNLLAALHYLPVHDPQSIVIESRNWNRLHAEPLARLTQPHTNSRDPERPLRIGYVSPDFRVHAVSQFMLPLLESHDRGLFHIFGYADVATPDDLTARLQAQVHTWRNIVGMTNEKVAALIRQDEIDILVDLAGHTADNRLLVLAMKPAPIQVTYLGYPGTTGVAAIDYRFTDALADPPGMTDAYFSERLIRLPQSAWCLREPPNAPPISELPAIKAGFVTFGSFNNFAKVNVPLLKIWARILLGMANSRLRLKAQGLGSNLAQQVVLQTMADCGIEPGRVDVSGWVPQPRHLAQYGQIDIALDAYPYHGTTTTCEAIWMGVPVVTLAGMNHLSRVGVSLLTNLGLPQLIAQSPEQYIQIAIAMAGDLPRLAALRATLRQRLKDSPLMNGPRQARDIESAYRAMWRHWCQTSRPK